MTAVLAWLRLDLRRRWRSLAVLALLLAVAAGTVLTALAGARRGASALPRLAAASLPATVVVLPNQPGFDWDRVRALPEVEALSGFALGLELGVQGIGAEPVGFPPVDRELLSTIERPVVFAGRVPDPDRADEVAVTPGFLTRYGKRVGDALTMPLYTPRQVHDAGEDGEPVQPAGPRLQVRIVGVIRSPWASGGVTGEEDVGLLPSYGLFARYRDNFFNPRVHYVNALVRLRGGPAALPAFEHDLARVTGRADIDVWNFTEMMRHAQRSFAFQARCLLAFGLAALVASLVLVGQAVARYTAAGVADLQVLTALGMTPRQAALAASAGPVVAALAGAAGGVAAAAVASAWFPIGTAAKAEPSPGVRLDATVLGTGAVAVPLLVLAGAVAVAWLALGSQRLAGPGRPSAAAAAAARAGLAVPVVVGIRFALEAGRGRTVVPVRPALFGAVAGVLGVLGAFTFSSGVADAARTPARFGQTWQLEAFTGLNGNDFVPTGRMLAAVAADRDVVGVNDARVGVAQTGANTVTLLSHSPVGHPVATVLLSGRLPASTSEVVLAPGTAALLGAPVGSRLAFRGSRGTRELTVVGTGFVASSPHNDYDSGGWVTGAAFDSLFGSFKFHVAQVQLRPGADATATQARLAALAAAVPGGGNLPLGPPERPAPIGELRQVRVLPVVLGAFLVLLAVGAVGHALATAVRRRRLDVAVLRALGMTRWQCRAVVVTQASVLALVGVVFGAPPGVALGRAVWRAVAAYTPLQYVPPMALWALLLVGPLALLVANLLAARPGHQAARLRIGHVLRAE